jgi:hypothetical protein
MLRSSLLALTLLLPLAASDSAHALSLELGCVTGNSATDCATGEAQLLVDVTISSGSAAFEFSNSGPIGSRITDIYFHDANGLFDPSSAVLTSVGNVAFSSGARPPAWGALGFTTDYAWGSQSHGGIDPGESLTIEMKLASGSLTEADLLRAIFRDGTFNLGLKVGAFPGGGSEGFRPIPEPRPAALFGAGLLVVSLAIGRQRRSAGLARS